ncbi:uncharacterized protein LOC123500300 [Portunus trituberculatus]|uniref:uncharacterized protein LOC123500300 n=1 Tax=Portunus trituberculatus TaxID=210409 RepID=UPI001E1D1F13|nr:uncharacterized protein LOC123500300 [Portunus trituberculatus]
MYLDDWLIHSPTKEGVLNGVSVTLKVLGDMGFQVNWDKSAFTSEQKLCCGEGLLGCLNFAAPTLPLGCLKLRRLTWEVNRAIPILPRDLPRPVTPTLHSLLRSWLQSGALRESIPWFPAPPQLTVATDASDVGSGFQSSWRHQACGGWSEENRFLHINLRELFVVQEWLFRHHEIRGLSVRFDMDNVTAVHYIQRQGTARSRQLLALSEDIFAEASLRQLSLSAKFVPGRENTWADALSRFRGSSVEWRLRLGCSTPHTRYRTPQVDLFASSDTAQLPLYLTYNRRTRTGGPDAFTEDWNQWDFFF